MQRTSPLYYIAPSAITITPNANGSPDDLAVYIARGTKIKIFYPPIPALVTEGAEYQEWTLTGRNRRLADSTKPYTIYARLRKVVNSSDAAYVSIAHADAYLVFAPQIEIDGRWTDPYILSPNISSTEAMTTTDADGNVYSWGPLSEKQTQGGRTDYWWVKIGTVSAPVNGERTVDLDTGILGTELYNTDWYLQPDSLPIRIELSCKIRGKEVGLNPYVAWGESLTVSANLVEGWVKDVSLMVDHWTIARNTGDSPGDAAWNYPDGGSARQMPNGQITLAHEYNNDDFAGKPSATFSVTAWGYAGGDTLVALATALISVAAETRGEYQAELSSYIDVITVDDVGNVIGGLWRDETYTDADGQEQTVRKYRISVAVSVRRGEDILTLAPDSQENAGPGTYKIGAAPQDCTCSLENSVLVITGITNVKDGVAGSADDVNFDYDAMRLMESCMVRLVIDCEGVSSISKDIPITIKHDSQPFVGADMENEHSGVSWNEKTSAFVGLPVDIPLRMWHNDTDLEITGLSIKVGDVARKYIRGYEPRHPYTYTSFQPPLLPIGTDLFPYGIYITTTDEVVNSVKRPVLHVTRAGSTLPNQTDIIVTITAEYAGISYERTLVHTLTRVSDLNVYSLAVTPAVVHKKKGQSDDAQTVKAAIMGNSSDDGRYELTSSEATAKKLCVMCRLLQAVENAAQLIDTAKGFTSESQWTAPVSYAGWVKSDTVTTDGTTTSVLFALLQDGKLYALETEEIPVMQDGDDGTDVEFVYYAPPNSDTMPLQDLRVSYRSSTGVLLRYGGKIIDNLTGADLVTALANTAAYQTGEYLPWVDTDTQWTDEPVGVASNRTFEYYAKREKVDGVWQPFSEVHVWSHYAKDGDPALVFDLTNENSFVQAMEDGTVVGDYETTQCKVYRGGVEVSSSFTFSIDSTQHITASVNGSTVNVSAMAQKDDTTQAVVNMAVVVIKATGKANTEYAGKELLANYYVRKTYATVVYRLALSAAAIPCNSNGQAKGGQIAFSVIRSERGQQTVLDSISSISNEGLTITYNGTKLSNNNIKDYSIIGSSSYLKVNLYKGFVNAQNPGELWDTETLPKTLDGSNGEGVAGQGIFRSIVFTRTYDDISGATVQGGQYAATADRGAGIPNNTTYNGKTYVWSDGIPQGEGDIWSASRIFTSDGLAPQNNWSSPRKMVDVPDTFDVEFCAGDPSSQPPTPTANNRHKSSSPYGYSGQVWFDPELDKYSASGVLRDFSVMTWRAERWTIDGVPGEWAVYKIVGEQGEPGPAGDSWFKSTMFVRMNSTPTKPAANKGSYTNPSPSGCVAGTNSAGVQVSWSDGIPAGDNTLWATTRAFCSDVGKSDSEWGDPRKMTDTATYDVEFCPYTEDNKPSGVTFSNGQPPVPTAANRHGGSGTQVWFDPELDKNSLPSGISWQDMVWRAEKETVNGVEGTWVITRILGEQGDDGVVYYITCNRSTSWQCDSNGVVTESSKTFKLKGWRREGANAAENKAFFFRRISNGTAAAETTARTEQTYTLSGTVPYTSFVVEIYETQAAATAGTQPLAQLPFDFVRQGEPGAASAAGLRGLVIRVTEWEIGKEYRNDTDVTDSTVDRYLDIATVSLKPNGDLFNPSDNTIYQCRDSHTSQASDQNADKTLKEDHWIPFTQEGPIATPLLWAARALIQYLQVHQITLTDGSTTIGGLGFGNYPIYLGGADTSSCTFRVENNGILILGTMPESSDADKRRIVIDPIGKSIGIYDSDGNLVTELSATKYHSVKGGETSIFTNERAGSSSLTLSGGSNNEVPINNYETKSSDDDTYNANMVASLTGMNAIETNISVWLSGWLYIHHAVIRIGVRTVANGTETFDWFGDKGVVTAGTYYRLDAWRRVKVKPGTHSIVIKVLERDSSDAYLRFGTAYVNWKADEYKAHFFGNGFSVGSNSDNHFSVYNANEDNEQNQRINLELNNGVGGLQLTKSGLGTYIFGHRFPLPITICSGAFDTNGNFAGRLWNEKSQSVLNADQQQSSLTNGLYVIDLSQLLYDSVGNEFPTPTALGINWMFTLTPYNTSANTATAHVKQISGSFLTIQTAVNGSKAACAFRIKIEYMGFPGDN